MSSTKKILIVTPYFAPQAHAAVFRAHKLAKYLPERGWEVHVLTVDTNYIYNEDEGLLKELPADVKIHRTRYVEPTLRGLRMAMGGRDRTFKAVKLEVESSSRSEENQKGKVSLARKAYKELLDRRLHSPDPYWTWKASALEAAKTIIRKHQIPLVFTSSSPFTTLSIGAELKRSEGVKWVADFRDLMTYDQRIFSKHDHVFAKQRNIEKMAMETADAITCLASSYPSVWTDTYGMKVADKTEFIPTGFDEKLLSKDSQTDEKADLVFVGEFQKEYGSEFFEILRHCVEQKMLNQSVIRLKIVGRSEVNRKQIFPLIEHIEETVRVEFVDHMPQRELYTLIANSRAVILNTSRHFPWWCCFAKLTDYIVLQKPVLAVLPDPSEARKWLSKSGLGVFLDGSEEESGQKLAKFLNGSSANLNVNAEVVEQFKVSHQVKSFEEIFLKLI